MSKIYALLVGIDKYHPDSKGNFLPLDGCKNDVEALVLALQKIFQEGETLFTKDLLDEDATYDAIVHHFSEKGHLGQAGPGDYVLFAFSGHGSREIAHPDFNKYFPEGKLETLVCYDSRLPGGMDLADKELAVLIKNIVEEKKARVCVLLDCCHSGSGTRMEDLVRTARQYEEKLRERDYKDFLYGYFEKNYPDKEALELPAAPHVLLAACDRAEQAYEAEYGLSHRGVFSRCLEKIILETSGELSYKSLYQQVRLAMMKELRGKKQSPQLEAYGFFNIFDGFLGKTAGASSAEPASIYYRKSGDGGHWRVDRGILKGNLSLKGESSFFKLFDGQEVIGRAKTIWKGVEESIVELEMEEDAYPDEIFQAQLISETAEKLPVAVSGSTKEVLDDAKIIIKSADFKANYFELIFEDIECEYQLWIEEKRVKIIRSADQLVLKSFTRRTREIQLQYALRLLEHIAAWEKLKKLDNPQISLAVREEISFSLSVLDDQGAIVQKYEEPDIALDIPIIDGKPGKVFFQLEIKNNNQALQNKKEGKWHCGLLHLGDEYDVNINTLASFNEYFPPGEKAVVAGAKIYFSLRPGEHEYTNIFKLIVSKERTNLALLTLPKIEIGREIDLGKRHVGLQEKHPDVTKWFAKTMSVRLVARTAAVGAKTVDLNGGQLKIAGHKSFSAQIGLTTVSGGGRSLADPSLMIAGFAKAGGGELLRLGKSQEYLGAPNALLLNNIQNPESLKSDPLILEINSGSTEKAEIILPLVFDGENILPAGEVSLLENGNTQVKITELPPPPPTRSLRQAASFCFLKLALQEDPQHLRRVDYGGQKARRVKEGVRQAVAEAENVLLLIHGLLGNTKNMAEMARSVYKDNRYDLVLTFDYENLNTPIEKTAGKLSEMLQDVDLKAGGGKKLTILAHSLGGLVSRFYVENLDGKELVDRLILVGVPNAGAALAKATTWRDRAFLLLGLSLNLPWNIPVVASLIAILAQSKLFTPTLEQMNYDKNPFLKGLNRNADPGVPYDVVAGDMKKYFDAHPKQQKLLEKLLKKSAGLLYQEEVNDLFASLDSIKDLPPNWRLKPKIHEVAGHHLNYFEAADSRARITTLLREKK